MELMYLGTLVWRGPDRCTCGNSTSGSGAKLPGSACSEPPPPTNGTDGTWLAPTAGCLSGNTSCPCAGNASQACGMRGVARVYQSTCTPTHGPGNYLCPLQGGRYMNNLSDIPYATWVKCFAKADLDGVATLEVPPIMANSHYAISPHYSLLCNHTKDPSSWYCTQALAGLRNFARHGGSASGYHAYEVMLSYQAVLDAGVKGPLNATELAAFQASVYKGVMQYAGHETRVENHGLDAAIEQLYMLQIWPKMNETCSSCHLDVRVIAELERVPQQILANWLHGHALDEYAIGYDAISIVRLIAVLEMIDTTDDLHSEDWKQFALRFADSITPAGCFSNHGGGLQDDGSPYTTSPYRLRTPTQAIPYGSCSGVFPFVFFFERTATIFQHRDPQAASYCKWAARALFRQINPYNDFANLYYIVKAMNEEQAQVKAGGPIPIPDLVDIRSKTIMKNEYQKDEHRVDGGPVPAQHVLCSSRAVGSPYVQSSVYTVPGGYHGSGEQAGTMSHYE
eukprot:COSAG02_NODE_9107_length_2327_cov_9.291293_1_plen_509_part_00